MTIEWTAIEGEDLYQVRRRSDDAVTHKWIVEVDGLSYVDQPGAGEHSWEIRSRMDGTTTTRSCEPDPVTVG